MNSLTNIPLSSYSNVWTPLQQEFFPRNATPLATSTPAGMVYIPGNETYLFEVAGIEIERPPDSNIGIDG